MACRPYLVVSSPPSAESRPPATAPVAVGGNEHRLAAHPRKRVYIVDDHRFFVAGLSSLINHAADLEVCGSSQDGIRVVNDVRRLHPDLVLMDVKMPHTDGISIAKSLRRLLGDIPILFISSLSDPRVRQQAQRLGALGFLEKTQEPNRLLEGIRRALGL